TVMMKRTRHGTTNTRPPFFPFAILALAVLAAMGASLKAQVPPSSSTPSSGTGGSPLGLPQPPGTGRPGAPVLLPADGSGPLPPGQQPAPVLLTSMPPGPPRFQFKIDPKTPLKDLLPTAPKARKVGPLLTDDLSKVPEVEFQAPLARNLGPQEALKQTAH